MSRFLTWRPLGLCLLSAGLAVTVFLATPAPMAAQATISTGSVQGTVVDPQGAVVPGAKITITNKATRQSFQTSTTTTGTYNLSALAPGDYKVRIEAKGFKTKELPVTVQVGVISPANVGMELGSESVVVTVEANTLRVNTEQATVQDVVTYEQIEQLPVNGRNFLDLATLEPGVQIQDGATFDPTKNGFSSISFGGRAGRTARIELDGLDISDETVGTTTQNVPLSALQQFQVSQSTLDLSTELTSSGAVNITTRSGTNNIHGQLFYYGRSNQTSARIAPRPLDFGRKQFGGNFGGFFIKDKLFYFLDAERTSQSLQSPVLLTDPFTALSGSFNSPFTDSMYVAKVDWKIKGSWSAFYRFNYEQNLSIRGFNPGVYQPFANVDHTPVHAMGTDFTSIRFTHSFRVAYLKFRNAIADATQGVSNPAPGISLVISPVSGDFTCLSGGEAFCSGPNILAPQATFQTNKQGKYDGSLTFRSHILRYGIGVNRILGGGFAKFFGIAPSVGSQFTAEHDAQGNLIGGTELFAANSCGTNKPCFPGGVSNPLNYPTQNVLMGNGQGFFTEIPEFGLPAGGQFDTRFQWYVGDSWKIWPNFNLTGGLRYVRDTGRSDADLPAIPCSATTLITCTGTLLDVFGPGLGGRVRQPNKNYGGTLGIAWDPWKNGKTVIRVGTGIYYENAIFNNVLFDRPGRLQKGLFFGTGLACFGGSAIPVPLPGGGTLSPTFCNQPIGSVVSQIAAFQTQFQKAVIAAGPQSNGSFIGNTLAEGVQSTGNQPIAPNYRSPYSFQLNAGIEREIRRGTVLRVDYVRNVGLHYLLGIDVNHVGAARFLNKNAALNAIASTLGFCNATSIGAAIANCHIDNGDGTFTDRPANISDFANNGLDSGVQSAGGFPCPTCAFPGLNPNLGQNQMLFPIGRSVYNGLQLSLRSDLDHPLPGIRHLNLITSYALSRFKSQAKDQDFIINAIDFDKPSTFFGPSQLDRTHLLGVGAIIDLPLATRLGLNTHWGTAPPVNLLLPNSGLAGEIFRSDVTGDGTVGDVLPGTNIGAFGRDIKVSDFNSVITNYNNTAAGKLTPAGQALVAAGLFTQAQLVQLGAVTPKLALAPAGQVSVSPSFTIDMYLSWRLRVNKLFKGLPESVIVEPKIALFNVFNFQNFDPGGNVLSGVLNGLAGSVNGTDRGHRTNLINPGAASGVNWYAVPRQAEFGVKLTF